MSLCSRTKVCDIPRYYLTWCYKLYLMTKLEALAGGVHTFWPRVKYSLFGLHNLVGQYAFIFLNIVEKVFRNLKAQIFCMKTLRQTKWMCWGTDPSDTYISQIQKLKQKKKTATSKQVWSLNFNFSFCLFSFSIFVSQYATENV